MSWSDVADFFGTTYHGNGKYTYGPGMQVIQDGWQGLQNWWYQLTGQPEKTSSYQHLEEREDTAYQRAAADMAAAGLSKYHGVGPAASSSAGQSDPMAKAMEQQQLKSMKIANKEAAHNLKISEQLGIRSGDQNYAGKWATLGNVLFGFDPTDVEGGLIPWAYKQILSLINGIGDSGEPVPSVDSGDSGGSSGSGQADWFKEMNYNNDPVMPGVSYDQWKSIGEDMSRLQSQGPEAIEKFVYDHIKKATDEGIGSVANYSTLPSDEVVGIFGRSLEDDISYFANEMGSKGTVDDLTIDRIADFLSKRYSANKSDVEKKLRDKIVISYVVEGR